MGFEVNNKKCAVCEAYLFEDDDVVCCPVCGAPHHRDCYTSLGHCGLEEYHGTDRQYSDATEEKNTDNTEHNEKEADNTSGSSGKARICTQCGRDYPHDARFCPYCGYSEMTGLFAEGNFNNFNNFNIIDENADIGEGVTAKEASKVIHLNSFRYVSRFLTLSKKKKTSWNWAGFLLPGPWLAYRKMYKESIVAVIFSVISALLTFPLTVAIAQLPVMQQQTSVFTFLIENLPNISTMPLAFAAASFVLGLAIRVVCGLYGDWLYKNRVITAAKEFKSLNTLDEAEEAAARKKWTGVSFLGFMLAFLAIDFLPAIIISFI